MTADFALGITLSRQILLLLQKEVWSWQLALKRGLSGAICCQTWLCLGNNQKCGAIQRQTFRQVSAQQEIQRACSTQHSARPDGSGAAWIWTKAPTTGSLKFNWAHWTHQLTTTSTRISLFYGLLKFSKSFLLFDICEIMYLYHVYIYIYTSYVCVCMCVCIYLFMCIHAHKDDSNIKYPKHMY